MADKKTDSKTPAKAPAKPAASAKPAAKAPAAEAPKKSGKVQAFHASGGIKVKSKTAIAPLKKELKGTRIGTVDSDKRPQTRRVVVAYTSKHPKYGKYIQQRTILHVHDEKNESRTGDIVEVAACRPISKSKQWRLVRVVEKRAEQAAAVKSAREVQ